MDNSTNIIQHANEWCISIHDAALVLPGSKFRATFINQLETLRTNRTNITSAYLNSIGATSPAAKIAWAKLNNNVQQLPTAAKFEESCLK